MDQFGFDLFGFDLFGFGLFGLDLFGFGLFGFDLFRFDLFSSPRLLWENKTRNFSKSHGLEVMANDSRPKGPRFNSIVCNSVIVC